MSSLDILTNQDLVEVYEKAIRYKLEPRFIHALYLEIERRGIATAAV